jgi:hypothetical protein
VWRVIHEFLEATSNREYRLPDRTSTGWNPRYHPVLDCTGSSRRWWH